MATTPVKYFHSGMSGAPVLSGTAGALTALLDACLLNGFGLQTASSVVISNGIATATLPAIPAAAKDSTILVAGATPSGLNGEQRVTAATITSVSWATTEANGTATGTITIKAAPAGWAKVFSGTNLAAYKPIAPEATGCVLRVDDTGTTNARIRAYESMSNIDTGIGPIPLEGQVSGGLYWPKSGFASGTACFWSMAVDERGMYLAIAPSGGDRYTLLYAGDIASFKSGDAYGYLVTGNQADQTALTTVPDGCCGYSHRSARSGAYMARSYTALGQSVTAQRLGAHHNGSTADVYAGTPGYALGTYPNGPNNGLMTCALELYGQSLRGTLPGLLHPVQDCSGSFSTGDVVDGTDDMAGRRLLALRTGPPTGSAVPGTVFIDLTGPWRR